MSYKLSPFGDNLHEMSKPVFSENVKTCFLRKVRKNIINLLSAKFAHSMLTDKVPVKVAAENILKFIFFLFFMTKTALQITDIKWQAFFLLDWKNINQKAS